MALRSYPDSADGRHPEEYCYIPSLLTDPEEYFNRHTAGAGARRLHTGAPKVPHLKRREAPRKGRRRRPVNRALRARLQQIYGAVETRADVAGQIKPHSFPGSFVRSTVQVSDPMGSKIGQQWVRKQHTAGTGFQERLGRLQGANLEPFGGHLGPQNRSGRGSENELGF